MFRNPDHRSNTLRKVLDLCLDNLFCIPNSYLSSAVLCVVVASVPGLPHSVCVLIMRRWHYPVLVFKNANELHVVCEQ